MTAPITLPPPPAARTTTATRSRGRALYERGVLIGVGIVAAVALSGTALALSLTRSEPEGPSQSAAATPASTPGPVGGPADRELCEAIAPLVQENTNTVNTFAGLGERGTSERDAGIAGFQASIRDWVSRIEPVLEGHPSASAYLTRNFQWYIDSNRIYASQLKPGRGNPADEAAWNDASVALGAGTEVSGNKLEVAGWP